MEMFDRIRRLDALRAEPPGDKEELDEAQRIWYSSLDLDAKGAYLDKLDAFEKQELGLDPHWFWEMSHEELLALPEAYSTVVQASMAYSDALYLAALAREALKALQEPPDEP